MNCDKVEVKMPELGKVVVILYSTRSDGVSIDGAMLVEMMPEGKPSSDSSSNVVVPHVRRRRQPAGPRPIVRGRRSRRYRFRSKHAGCLPVVAGRPILVV